MDTRKKTILIKDADYIITMDANKRILKRASLFIEGSIIREVNSKRTKADRVISARGKIVIPGFINCHHHMFQCMMRGMPELQNQTIDRWINIVCESTKKMDAETIYYSALANMAELLLYGCTTTTDMLYLFPKGKKGFFETTIKAAKDIGIRFHPYRGSMSLSKKDGALFPDDVVQDSDTIASESEQMIRSYHDNSPESMLKIGLAPCTIFTSSAQDYKNAFSLSKRHGVNIQTHLSESEFENEYSVKKFHKRPLAYLGNLGWEGERVSFTHCININAKEIKSLAATKTNVVHCPISNARSPIGESGIAPVYEMLEQKVNVGIGVDGSAGNDSSNMLEELRWARTMQGVRRESTYLKPETVFRMGTINGARALNWESVIGSIEVGKASDIAIFSLDGVESAGACDPITALLSTQARRANTVVVNGSVVVEHGRLLTISEEAIVKKTRLFQKNHKGGCHAGE
ncbi:MAG: amidohydrolase family protein [Patescibacteria group bacterium]